MRLKRLVLHGYKTFPTTTEFLFTTGVTAIVGPNGSGKSNISDSIRWALGEQSLSELRVKKTEELIFSGSGARARLGMAEVSLTLENLDSWTDGTMTATDSETGETPDGATKTRVDPVVELLRANPSEVTLGRRAYRDGQNEYFLNGTRVRLRDVQELLSRWGLSRNTYAVISQGLIDQALTQRPEERRALFEEAAGIGLYQSKRQNAIEKLEETQQNLLRVNDIINEIAPRLPSLARQASRARSYNDVVTTLDEKLRLGYAFQWGRTQQIAQEATEREKETRETLSQRRKGLQEITARLAQLRRRGQELRARLADGRRTRSSLESEHAKLSREVAVLEERLRFTTQQSEEASRELAELEERKRAQDDRVKRAESEGQAREQERNGLAARLSDAETRLGQFEYRATHFEVHAEENESQVRALARKLIELKSQLPSYEAAVRTAASLSAQADELASFDQKHFEIKNAVESTRNQITDLRASLTIAERDIASARAAHQAAQESLTRLSGEISARSERARSASDQVVALTAQSYALQGLFDESSRALNESDERILPDETELADAEKIQIDLEEQESLLRAQLADFEEAHNRAVLDVERSNAEIARLETEIEDDLASGRIVSQSDNSLQVTTESNGEEQLETAVETTTREIAINLDPDKPLQLRFVSGEELIALPVVSAVPEGLEKEIRKLRNQIKYMGAVNANAPQEYDELKARHAFLTAQTADAHHAIESLQKAIAELDAVIRQKFQDTFKAVNTEFTKFFSTLFEGGTARLELTQPEDLTQTGVEIIAKPPGKRAAHLGLLSGGERALTATALLFAILKVSPTPFCVLDEVDAMLDEANVGRFRDVLKSLGDQSQFIVITHNRATIESADAVYGITMGEDGVSQAISLRLDGKGKEERAEDKGNGLGVKGRQAIKTRESRTFH